MTPDQLRTLRESRNLTREQLATELGGCTAPAIVKWERGERPIPDWVEDKMLRNVKIAFPLEDLHQLLDLAREEGISFEELLAEAISGVLTARRARKVTQEAPKAPPQPKPNIFPMHSDQRQQDAAETPEGKGPMTKTKVKYTMSRNPSKKGAAVQQALDEVIQDIENSGKPQRK